LESVFTQTSPGWGGVFPCIAPALEAALLLVAFAVEDPIGALAGVAAGAVAWLFIAAEFVVAAGAMDLLAGAAAGADLLIVLAGAAAGAALLIVFAGAAAGFAAGAAAGVPAVVSALLLFFGDVFAALSVAAGVVASAVLLFFDFEVELSLAAGVAAAVSVLLFFELFDPLSPAAGVALESAAASFFDFFFALVVVESVELVELLAACACSAIGAIAHSNPATVTPANCLLNLNCIPPPRFSIFIQGSRLQCLTLGGQLQHARASHNMLRPRQAVCQPKVA
jgi:hypothetical protein